MNKLSSLRGASHLLLALISSSLPSMCSTYGMTPDKVAYSKAINLPDPQAKIDALKLFAKKYPKSSRLANQAILETLVKDFPNRSSEIDKQIKGSMARVHGEERMYLDDSISNTLAEGGVLLPRAEQLSRRSLGKLNRKSYFANVRKELAAAKMEPLSDAELDHYFRQTRSMLQATLGRVYLKEGKIALGKPLLEAAYKDDPTNSAAAADLGTVAAQAGKKEEALAYLTKARLTGKLDAGQEKQLESLYRETHAGSPAGLEDYLDDRYLALFPSLKTPKHNVPAQTDRTVLLELFTGSGCPPCEGADLAVDGELERYTRKELAVLEFDQHIPEPDPMANPASVNRFKFYKCEGTPQLAIDGVKSGFVGGGRKDAEKILVSVNNLVDKALQQPAASHIELNTSRSGDRILVHATASNMTGSSNSLRLRIVLVENRLSYSGENGVRFHRMVVRDMASDDGFAVKPKENCSFTYSFDLQKISAGLKTYLDAYQRSNERFGPITFINEMYAINPDNLSVVAFVQDAATRRVLQAAYLPLPGAR